MTKSSEQQKISTKLILYIILFSSMITGILTVLQLFFQYTEEKSILEANLLNINTGYREGITNAVWLDDKVQLFSILDGVTALPDIEYVEVRTNNRVYASRGKAVVKNAVSSTFTLQRIHNNRVLTIGETYVEGDLSTIYKRIINRAWTILGLNAIKTFLVAIFMYFIFNRLVVKRLGRLSQFVRHYDIQNNLAGNTVTLLEDESYRDEITEIAQALDSMNEHLLRSVKELLGLKKTLDVTLDGVVMFHPDTFKIFYANTGIASMLNYKNEELLMLTPLDICADLTQEILKNLQNTSDGKEQNSLDMMTFFKSKNGKLVPVRLILQYVHPSHEEPRFVFTARDITERINAQREIQTLLDEAKAANAELESFSYSISHDLRTPLRAIDGFSLLLALEYADTVDDEGKDYINRVRKSAQHMGLLIDDMLSLARVTRGELNRRVYNLSEMANHSVKKLQEYEPKRKVTVELAQGVFGWVDKSLFQNLLDNLLGNAWKYTSKTEDAKIEFGSLLRNTTTIYYVKDNGAGFDMQYASKLFNAFQRLHEEDEFSGTGIGLATVSRILTRHGGRIWAEAEVDRGATFYFTIENEHQTAHPDHSTQQLNA